MAQPSIQNHITVNNALCAIKPDSYEEAVQTLWQAIVIEWFPQREGYKFAFKAQILVNNFAPDAVVLRLVALSENPRCSHQFKECPILMLQCKQPSLDTPAGWETTLSSQVLNGLYESANPTDRIFSVVAIGKKVRFYRFDRKAEQPLSPLHSDKIDLSATGGLAQVDAMMNCVKQQGYQWAVSSRET